MIGLEKFPQPRPGLFSLTFKCDEYHRNVSTIHSTLRSLAKFRGPTHMPEQGMPTTARRPDAKSKPEVRFLGFSGTLMIFSDSRLITRPEPQQPKKETNPKR
jgi:hypothetical protein